MHLRRARRNPLSGPRTSAWLLTLALAAAPFGCSAPVDETAPSPSAPVAPPTTGAPVTTTDPISPGLPAAPNTPADTTPAGPAGGPDVANDPGGIGAPDTLETRPAPPSKPAVDDDRSEGAKEEAPESKETPKIIEKPAEPTPGA